HPDSQLVPVGPPARRQPALRLRSGCERLIRALERDEERVALAVHLVPTVALEAGAQDVPMRVERLRVPVLPQFGEQSGRPLDVREEERDRSARLPRHPSRTIAPPDAHDKRLNTKRAAGGARLPAEPPPLRPRP